MKAKDIKALFPTEEALCERFIADLKEHGGWTVYPETAGFDILCVYDKTGHQLGIEAKLALNAKVADQIMPTSEYVPDAGPDFRAVIVPQLTDASAGIARLLRFFGVMVWTPKDWHRTSGFGHDLGGSMRDRHAFYDTDDADKVFGRWGHVSHWGQDFWHDWNPIKRCVLPEIVPDVPAGVPAPLRLTPWKVAALRVLAEIEVEGFITAKNVKSYGIDPRRFCATDGWLQMLGGGRWGRGSVPAFNEQHPEAYAQVLNELREKRAKETP